MTSQLVIFSAFFFFHPLLPKSDFFSRKSTNKKNLALQCLLILCTTLLPNFINFDLLVSSYKSVYAIRVKNTVDPDQLVYETPVDLENQDFSWLSLDLLVRNSQRIR